MQYLNFSPNDWKLSKKKEEEEEGEEEGGWGKSRKRKKEKEREKNEHINIRNYPKERSMNIHKDLSARIFMALLTIVENWKIRQGLITQKHEN